MLAHDISDRTTGNSLKLHQTEPQGEVQIEYQEKFLLQKTSQVLEWDSRKVVERLMQEVFKNHLDVLTDMV